MYGCGTPNIDEIIKRHKYDASFLEPDEDGSSMMDNTLEKVN